LANTYANLQFIFNPEFLTEKNYIDDFINQDRIVLGNTSLTFDRNLTTVIDTYLEAFPGVPVVITDSTTAEMVKYLANIYLATKVTFANEMKEICDGVGTSYDEVVKIAKLDKRLGDSHWQVPSPDGKRGFGGTCFPKDINALRAVCRDLYIDTPFLNAVWRKNLDVRPERDWEESKGRAVS
jgi:UDPglucose 6-dehydrogenase